MVRCSIFASSQKQQNAIKTPQPTCISRLHHCIQKIFNRNAINLTPSPIQAKTTSSESKSLEQKAGSPIINFVMESIFQSLLLRRPLSEMPIGILGVNAVNKLFNKAMPYASPSTYTDNPQFPEQKAWKEIAIGLGLFALYASTVFPLIRATQRFFVGGPNNSSPFINHTISVQELLGNPVTSTLFLFSILSIGIFGPIAEETEFRGILRSRDLARRCHTKQMMLEEQEKSKLSESPVQVLITRIKYALFGPPPLSKKQPIDINKAIKSGLITRTDLIKTTLKTSLHFGLMHIWVPSGLAFNCWKVSVCALSGALKSGVREWRGNLWAPTILHMGHNILCVLQSFRLISNRW